MNDLGGGQYEVEFVYRPPAGSQTVAVAGTFNGWSTSATALTGPDDAGRFRTRLKLAKGRYEYKFVVDGSGWITDPDNPHRTAGYQNAILYLGLPPDAEAPSPPPARSAGLAPHPPIITSLRSRLSRVDEDAARSVLLAKWLESHPQPVFTDDTVSFVFHAADANDVTLHIAAWGARTGYPLQPLVNDGPGFVVTLKRGDLPERAAYAYRFNRGDRFVELTDPHAWSLTSRSGRPAAALVESSPNRGRLEVIAEYKPAGSSLGARDIYIYLPPGYDQSPARRYPVLYMHDGQNCWDDPAEPFGHGGWAVNLTADRLINADRVRPFIVVGAANTPQRLREYGGGPSMTDATNHPYLQLLVSELKPLIDRKYRTRPGAADTAIMGSSMGGNISFQACLLMPDVFGQAGCLSPAFRYGVANGQGYADLLASGGKPSVRLYLDSGTEGPSQDGVEYTREMAARLRAAGWRDGVDLEYFEDTGAMHNERYWRERLHRPLTFLFGSPVDRGQ